MPEVLHRQYATAPQARLPTHVDRRATVVYNNNIIISYHTNYCPGYDNVIVVLLTMSLCIKFLYKSNTASINYFLYNNIIVITGKQASSSSNATGTVTSDTKFDGAKCATIMAQCQRSLMRTHGGKAISE